MDTQEIKALLAELDAALGQMEVKGEVCLYGGAVMCLVYQARPATKDVDAIFQPAQQIRDAARRIGARHGLREDWLNDAVKGFVRAHGRRPLFEFPNLVVYVPDPEYLLAMKCLAARADSTDPADVRFLARHLGLTRAEEVLRLVQQYYPHEQIRPATRFFIEEIMA